jgi:hypothetical protein
MVSMSNREIYNALAPATIGFKGPGAFFSPALAVSLPKNCLQ